MLRRGSAAPVGGEAGKVANMRAPEHAGEVDRRGALRLALGAATAGAGLLCAPERADARPSITWFSRAPMAPRRIDLRRAATGERFNGVYFAAGRYIPDALAHLDWVLRDVHADRAAMMDLALVNLLCLMNSAMPGRELIVTSAYRTRATNDRLRRRTGLAARNSLHLHGMAVDFYCQRVPPRAIARLARRFDVGGVGRYDRLGFVHVDVGVSRYWRR